MKLIEQINVDFIAAYKASKGNETKRLEKDFLGVLKTEVTKENKEPEDVFIVNKIKAMIKNSAATNSLSGLELSILEKYLPKQLSESELKVILENEVNINGYNLMSDMGKLMSFLKNNYNGEYDGKTASTLVRLLLK